MLNGRNQNSIRIVSLRSETLYSLNQFKRKFRKQKNYIKELLHIFLIISDRRKIAQWLHIFQFIMQLSLRVPHVKLNLHVEPEV